MSKPLDVEAVHEFEGWSTLWYMARGHVDKQQFVDEIKIEFEEEYSVDQVEHRYAHNRPAGKGDHRYIIDLVGGPGRGNYLVTIIDLWKV